MNKNLNKICKLAEKPARLIIGLMSGTSLDGLDVALCRIAGSGADTKIELLQFHTISYEPAFKEQIRSVFSKRSVDLEKVCLLNGWVGKQHAAMILQCLSKWGVDPAEVDLIASHGQTIYHAPAILHGHSGFGNGTLQIGDGDHIAVDTGIITLSDFRQKHIAAGGEGAPLAVYGDYFIFSKKGENRIMLNIGGIANFTFLPGDLDATRIYSTDTGPGNTLMDAYMQRWYQQPYDKDAAVASAGTVHPGLLAALRNNDFFAKGFPKTTGPELFNLDYLAAAQTASGTTALSGEDIMATLNSFSATTIIEALQKTAETGAQYVLYSSGGGMHNPRLMEQISAALPGTPIYSTDVLEINPDAKEAVLFAVLANEAVAGGETKIGNGTAGIPSVTMGKISFPA
jgi:anhydro-N-acetylmuramic acid kinase